MQTLYNYGIRCAQDILDAEAEFLKNIPGIGEEKAKVMQEDAARVIKVENEEFAQLKAGEEAVAREQARIMFEEVAFRRTLMCEEDRIIRVKGIDSERAAGLEGAGLLFVEDIAGLTSLGDASEKSGLSPEQLDELVHAATVYLNKEKDGTEMSPSTADAGPEDGYAPSLLLNPELEGTEGSEAVAEA